MAGQPDWQRFASATGPVLLSQSPGTSGNSGIMYLGPWRSLFVNANTSGLNSSWFLDASYYNDPAGSSLLRTNRMAIDNGKTRIGWITVYSPWIKFTWTFNTGSVTPLNINVYPNMLDAVMGSHATNIPYITTRTATVNADTAQSIADCAYSMPGPAIVSLYATAPRMVVTAYTFNGDGSTTAFGQWQLDEPYRPYSLHTSFPDGPGQFWGDNHWSAYPGAVTISAVPD